MEFLPSIQVANAEDHKVRRAILNGRRFLVVRGTLIVPGVLNGSRGALYYPPEEVAANPQAWNGTPIVVNHPMDDHGQPLSGRDPQVINKWGIGWVFESVTHNGNHVAELWFDVEHTKRVDRRIHDRIVKGQPIELSTGLFTDNEEAPHGSTDPKGTAYHYIARNYRPDHLAILPDQKGACSVQDGCGVGVVANRDDATGEFDGDEDEQEEQYEHQTFSGGTGKKKKDKKDKKREEAAGKGTAEAASRIAAQASVINDKEYECNCGGTCDSCKTTNALPGQPKSVATGKFKHMGSGTGKGPIHQAAQQGAMMWTTEDRERGASIIPGEQPLWATDNKKWAKAMAEAGDSTQQNYWITVAHLYRKFCGGKLATNQTPQLESDMDRTKVINWLTTNCGCWKGEEAVETLNEMSDTMLQTLYKSEKESTVHRAVVNTVQQAYKAETGKTLALNAMPAYAQKRMAKVTGEEEGTLPEQEGEVATPAPAPPVGGGKGKKQMVVEEEVEEEPVGNSARRRAAKPTMKEWLANMPPEAQAVWNSAAEVDRRERAQLANAIVANGDYASDEARKEDFVDLMKQPLPQLKKAYQRAGIKSRQQQVANVRKQVEASEDHTDLYAPNYEGAFGGPSSYGSSGLGGLTDNADLQAEVLDIDSAREQYDPQILNMRQASGRGKRRQDRTGTDD